MTSASLKPCPKRAPAKSCAASSNKSRPARKFAATPPRWKISPSWPSSGALRNRFHGAYCGAFRECAEILPRICSILFARKKDCFDLCFNFFRVFCLRNIHWLGALQHLNNGNLSVCAGGSHCATGGDKQGR